jgi:hypothetical protein
VATLDELLPALAKAPAAHVRYADIQSDFALASLGDTSGTAPDRAVAVILEALADGR